jgi:hypothetical protein
MYYAVRGRLLLVSPSRTALIRSLTLTKQDRLQEDEFSELDQAGNEDIRGTIVLADDQSFGSMLESVAFAVRIDGDAAHAKCRGALRPDAARRFSSLLNGTRPATLEAPPTGMIALSANFGKPVKEVWSGLGDATGVAWLSDAQWQTWEEGVPGEPPGVAQFITTLLGAQGPGIRLTVTDVDVNEFLPIPILVGTADGDTKAITQLFEAIPPPPDSVKPWETYPRFDADKRVAYMPLVGGPSLELAATVNRDTILFGSSRAALETELLGKPAAESLPEPGNLYVQIQPAPLVDALVESGRLLVEIDGLRGFTGDSFEVAAAEWTASATLVNDITAVVSFQNGAVDLELRIECEDTIAAEAGG